MKIPHRFSERGRGEQRALDSREALTIPSRTHEGGVRAPPLHPVPLPERDPGAGRIVVKVAQDPTPLHGGGDGAPTGAVRGRSAMRVGGEAIGGNLPRNRARESAPLSPALPRCGVYRENGTRKKASWKG